VFVFLQSLGFWSFCSPGLDPVVVVVPRQKTKTGFWLGSDSLVYFFPAEFLT